GHAATRSSFAWLNANDKTPRAYHDLNHAGMRAWAALSARLGGAPWYRPAGNIEWAEDEPGRARLAARVRRLTGWGYPARRGGAPGGRGPGPARGLPAPVAAAAWFPGEGYLLTEPLVSQLAGLAVQRGATLLAGEPGRVTGLDTAGGAVRAVRTAAGQVIAVDAVVCCAGRWVPGLAALAGAAAPVPLVPSPEPAAPPPRPAVQPRP